MKFDHTTQWYMHKPESVLENEIQKNSMGFQDTNSSPNPSQNTSLKKKRTCQLVGFAIPADHKEEIKENEKRD